MEDPGVLLAVEDGVATVTLNRPSVLNALNVALAGELVRALESCSSDPGVRVVVLTGAGSAFCAGGDLKAAWDHIQAGRRPGDFFSDLTLVFHRAIVAIRMMEKPVLAAVNGAAGGAGISLAACCDLRIARESARFRQAYTSIGLVPDGGWTLLVSQIVGWAKAAELVLLDPVFDAREALNMGLLNDVVADADFENRIKGTAAGLARGATAAFGGAKTLLNAALLPALEAQLALERQRITAQAGTRDFIEGLSAFREKRKPAFRGS